MAPASGDMAGTAKRRRNLRIPVTGHAQASRGCLGEGRKRDGGRLLADVRSVTDRRERDDRRARHQDPGSRAYGVVDRRLRDDRRIAGDRRSANENGPSGDLMITDDLVGAGTRDATGAGMRPEGAARKEGERAERFAEVTVLPVSAAESADHALAGRGEYGGDGAGGTLFASDIAELRTVPLPEGVVDLDRDRELVERSQGGDTGAFGLLYSHYYRRIYLMCLKRLGDRCDAEDVAKESFERAYKALPGFAGDKRFFPWLSVIASNLCIGHLRKRSRSTPSGEIELVATRQQVPGEDLEEVVMAGADAAVAAQAFSRLRERHRRILEMREQWGWSYQEIADHERIGIEAVQTLLWRARQALKREFCELEGNEREGRRAKVGALGAMLIALRGIPRRLVHGSVRLAAHVKAVSAGTAAVAVAGVAVVASIAAGHFAGGPAHDAAGGIRSPLPGSLLAVRQGAGQSAGRTVGSGLAPSNPATGASLRFRGAAGTGEGSGNPAIQQEIGRLLQILYGVTGGAAGSGGSGGSPASTLLNGAVGTVSGLLPPGTGVGGGPLGGAKGAVQDLIGSSALSGLYQTVTSGGSGLLQQAGGVLSGAGNLVSGALPVGSLPSAGSVAGSTLPGAGSVPSSTSTLSNSLPTSSTPVSSSAIPTVPTSTSGSASRSSLPSGGSTSTSSPASGSSSTSPTSTSSSSGSGGILSGTPTVSSGSVTSGSTSSTGSTGSTGTAVSVPSLGSVVDGGAGL